jgi:O-antigen/teichoic acid export membrane protein
MKIKTVVKQKDFFYYIFLLLFATVFNLLSIKLISEKFGIENFAKFTYSSIFIQIILAFSDLGIKYSYFRTNLIKNKIIFSLIVSRVLIALTFFLIFSIFFIFKNDDLLIYMSFAPFILGSAIFPNFVFQNYNKFKYIGLNVFLYRFFIILLVFVVSNIFLLSLISGLISFVFSLFSLLYFKKLIFFKIEVKEFKLFFFKFIKQNFYLNLINIVSVIEINFQSLISKYALVGLDFNLFIYTERIVSIIKQVIITMIDFLYPKINNNNFQGFIFYKRVIIIMYLFIILLIIINFDYFHSNLFNNFPNNDKYKFFIILFLIYPLSIFIFNFIQNILFIKNGFDKYSLYIQLVQIFFKIISIWFFIDHLGIIIIPFILIFNEFFAGVFKSIKLEKKINKFEIW